MSKRKPKPGPWQVWYQQVVIDDFHGGWPDDYHGYDGTSHTKKRAIAQAVLMRIDGGNRSPQFIYNRRTCIKYTLDGRRWKR